MMSLDRIEECLKAIMQKHNNRIPFSNDELISEYWNSDDPEDLYEIVHYLHDDVISEILYYLSPDEQEVFHSFDTDIEAVKYFYDTVSDVYIDYDKNPRGPDPGLQRIIQNVEFKSQQLDDEDEYFYLKREYEEYERDMEFIDFEEDQDLDYIDSEYVMAETDESSDSFESDTESECELERY
jgi:hypothetical protein